MKKMLFFLLLSEISFGFNSVINCVTATGGQILPITYTAATLTSISNVFLRATPSMMIANPTSCRICANTVSSTSTLPIAGSGKEYCIPANSMGFWDVTDVPRGPANVYLRSDVSTCSSGIVDLNVW